MPPPTTRTSKVRAVSAIEVAVHAGERRSSALLLSAWRRSTRFARTGSGTSTISRSRRHPVGSRGFFDDLDQYHFEKLHHLLRLVDFDGYRGRAVLEVGCGAGVDLARFAKGGADVTGVDLAASAIELARANFAQQGLQGEFRVADGEQLPFPDDASISSTRTASCSTRPTRSGWSTSAAAC